MWRVAVVVSACGTVAVWVCENAGTCTKSAEEVGFRKVQMELVEQEVVVGSEPVFKVK